MSLSFGSFLSVFSVPPFFIIFWPALSSFPAAADVSGCGVSLVALPCDFAASATM